MLVGLIKTLRPKQWIKNLFVGVPLFFAQRLDDPDALLRVAGAFGLFCLISGSIYLINDLVDVDKDRAHPKKCRRPIPSGQLPEKAAKGFLAFMVPAGFAAAFLLDVQYAGALAAYFLLNLAYCFKVKQIAYLDVVSIALGFVLRLLSGAFVIDVEPSVWLLAETGLLSMFLGFGKRAHELSSSDDAVAQRPSLAVYNKEALRWILHVLALATAVVYALYIQSEHVAQTFGGAPLIWTLPFPIIGILRFVHLVTSRHDAESPTEEMLKDPLFMGNFAVWILATGALLYGLFP